MWAVINTTPYAAGRTWLQDKDANKVWLVVVKATFEWDAKGETRLADEQVPVLQGGEYLADPARSSLVYESDLAGVKPTTDVLVNANAWAPRGRLASAVDVRVRVGRMDKRLRVFGDRVWKRGVIGPAASDPALFERLPITYERAFGGWDRTSDDAADHRLELRNPAGKGFFVDKGHSIGKPLPNIERPDALIESWSDRPEPVGIGAIACHWSPRRELAGTYDERWKALRHPLWAEDFDTRYHCCAPADQQSDGYLRGSEPVELTGLSPDGVERFALPRIYPVFETHIGSERKEHRGQLCTVIIEPERRRVMMSWQTSLVCNRGVDDLDATIVTEKRWL